MTLAQCFPGTGIDYFLALPLDELGEMVESAVKVVKRRGGG